METLKKTLKMKKVTFSDFYCLINSNTKFWITNKKMFIKKSLLVIFIAPFLQLLTTNKTKTFKNQNKKRQNSHF